VSRNLHVVTYNIHKGLSLFNRKVVIHELRDRLRTLGADIVFLQEVLGTHERHAERYLGWPAEPQYEFLADTVWADFAYGRNAVYDHGHHGNAILSRFPIQNWVNQDVSSHRFERRGLLHCQVGVPGWDTPLHCVCVHLALTARGRSRQLERLRQRIERLRLDRIYIRGFRVSRAHVHHGPVWGRISDHAALTTTLERL
jgi:endonuclease/exonuclease/phosphatase family metal-dependent hydrolase